MRLSLPKTSKHWIQYFELNEKSLLSIPWESSERTLVSERRVVANSMKVFQLGESSEGKHLMSVVRTFANQQKDVHLEDAMTRFIAEEQRHARYLGTFMDREGIPRARGHWTDRIFRCLRRLWNLEVSLAVLLTAELVARVYYRALYHATSSNLLRQICRQLLRDEVMHVYFHTHLLRNIRRMRAPFLNRLWNAVYRLFFACTLLAVWSGHHKVLRAGGFPFLRYWTTANSCCKHALRLLVYEQSPAFARQTEVSASCAIRIP